MHNLARTAAPAFSFACCHSGAGRKVDESDQTSWSIPGALERSQHTCPRTTMDQACSPAAMDLRNGIGCSHEALQLGAPLVSGLSDGGLIVRGVGTAGQATLLGPHVWRLVSAAQNEFVRA
jgi:hypothetical protein